jgi:hypothetical protein
MHFPLPAKRASTGAQIVSLMLLLFCLLLAVTQLGSSYSKPFLGLFDFDVQNFQRRVQHAKDGMEMFCAYSTNELRRLRVLAMHRAGLEPPIREELSAGISQHEHMADPAALQLLPVEAPPDPEMPVASLKHTWHGTNVFGSILLPSVRRYWSLQDWWQVRALQELQRAAAVVPAGAQNAAANAMHGFGQSVAVSKAGIKRAWEFVEPLGSGAMQWSKPGFTSWTAPGMGTADPYGGASATLLLCCSVIGALLLVVLAVYANVTRRRRASSRTHAVASTRNAAKSREVWPLVLQ